MQAAQDTTTLGLSDIQGNIAGFNKPLQSFVLGEYLFSPSISGLKPLAGRE